MKFHHFTRKSGILLKMQKYFCNSRNFFAFSAPRGPNAPGLIKPMEFYPFLGLLGALGPIFRKIQLFQ